MKERRDIYIYILNRKQDSSPFLIKEKTRTQSEGGREGIYLQKKKRNMGVVELEIRNESKDRDMK
jgi:hypothetical protein